MSVLLVTGGGTGIGAAVAKQAALDGHAAVICGRREGPLQAVAKETGATPVAADMTRPEEVARTVAAVIERYGRLDGVVANAGIMRAGSALDLTVDDWDAVVATNLRAAFLLFRETLPHLLDTRGAAVAVSSIAALRASSGSAAYAAAKAGLTMLTQTVAVDFGPRGVRANVVCPGWVRTEMADVEMAEFGAADGLSREAAYTEVTRLVPQRRPADPGEVAAAVLWLLGPQATYVNGAVLAVDGGTTLVDAGTVPYNFRLTHR
jgi:meso-butanediol dehydrogenase / (S,S)-butanediol dehydrogenase / diacetyl reductase